MSRLVRCDAMPDEPAWGHFMRFAQVNGFRSIACVSEALPDRKNYQRPTPTLLRTLIAEHLAGSRKKRPLYEYFQAHTTYSQVLPISSCVAVWRYMLNRWSYHNADLFPTPLVIRFCPMCVAEDLDAHGFSWFRREHQLAGVSWCLKHSRSLHQLPAPMQFLHSRGWFTVGSGSEPETGLIVPPFVRRYTKALEWLTQRSGSRKGVQSLLIALNRVEYGQDSSQPFTSKTGGVDRSPVPSEWHRTNFPDAKRRSRWGLEALAECGMYTLAVRAAQLSSTMEDIEHIMNLADAVSGQVIDDSATVLNSLDLDNHDTGLDIQKNRYLHMPICARDREHACVGLAKELRQASDAELESLVKR